MIRWITDLLGGGQPQAQDAGPAHDPVALASAVLMVEAACHDGVFDDRERQTVKDICRQHFDLSEKDADDLIEDALADQQAGGDLHPYTQVIKNNFDEADRIRVIEMLWQVVYADGELHDFEANLLRRIGGLIYVSDRDRGEARKRVLTRMGLSDRD